MRPIQQRRSYDCGVAVAATILEVPYREAVERLRSGGPISVHRLACALKPLEPITVPPLRRITVRRWAREHNDMRGALMVVDRWGNYPPHWVAIDHGVVYDPQPDPECRAYSQRQYVGWIISVLKQKRPRDGWYVHPVGAPYRIARQLATGT